MTELISLDEALAASREELVSKHRAYVNPAFQKMLGYLGFDKKFVQAQGTKVWDEAGVSYLDFLGGYGSLNLGHNPETVYEAIEKVKSSPNILQASMGILNASLAENLARITPRGLQNTFFCNSGAEAIEASIKLARKVTGRPEIISAQGSFHGKTMGALSVSGRDKFKKGFSPLLPNCKQVPFGDIEALENALSDQVAAVLLEPIQGEGGVIMPPDNYLTKARELCNQYQALLIVDEIQTGLGRTGKLFATQWEQVEPDVLCLAKSLGGGVIPMGAMITRSKHWQAAYGSMDSALLHTSTFGGNTVASAAGIQSLNLLINNDLAEAARTQGAYMLKRLSDLASENTLIKEVRGKGLLIGMEFHLPEKDVLDKISKGMVSQMGREYAGAFVAERLLNEYQVITAYTLNNPNVIRLEPPLTVTSEELDYVIASIKELTNKYDNFYRLALSSGKKAMRSFFRL